MSLSDVDFAALVLRQSWFSSTHSNFVVIVNVSAEHCLSRAAGSHHNKQTWISGDYLNCRSTPVFTSLQGFTSNVKLDLVFATNRDVWVVSCLWRLSVSLPLSLCVELSLSRASALHITPLHRRLFPPCGLCSVTYDAKASPSPPSALDRDIKGP